MYNNLKKLLEEFKVNKNFMSVEHPQINGQAEVENQMLLRGLERRLEMDKRN